MKNKLKIIEYSRDKFLKDGIYKTRMDDIAKDLRISKKTLYKYFASKDELVKGIFDNLKSLMHSNIKEVLQKDAPAIEKFIALIQMLGKFTSRVNDKALNELKIHYNDVWKEIENFRENVFMKEMKSVFEQGKSEGLINDFPTQLLLTIYLGAIRAAINPEFITNNKFAMKEVVELTFRLLMEGALTNNGKKHFKKIKREQRNEFL
jgi:AcrR family transcriptional regulator